MTLGRVGGRRLGVVVFVAALGLWELGARSQRSFLVPPASAVAERAWQVWPTTEYLTTVAASLERLTAGFVLGAGCGIALGLAMGSWGRVGRTLEPVTEFLRAIPAIAIVPVVIVVLGVDDATRITVIAFAVSFPVLVSTIEGVRAVSPEVRDTASMLHVGTVERIVRIELPAALPSIVAGLRIALSAGIVALVISEFAVGGDGVGHYIRVQESLFNVPDMYAGILFLGLLGYVLNTLFLVAERRVLAWHFGAAGESA
jgi:ABC-type nitrate/sulfonate/bicarbonate transport system permease component